MDYENLTIADVEELVGRKAEGIEVRKNEVILSFSGTPGHATVHFHMRKW